MATLSPFWSSLSPVFLISCKSNNEKTTSEEQKTDSVKKDSAVSEEKPQVVDSNNTEIKPIAKPVVKPIKPVSKPISTGKTTKDSVSKPVRPEPGPVCKYGVIKRDFQPKN
jgi:hypothetical protein